MNRYEDATESLLTYGVDDFLALKFKTDDEAYGFYNIYAKVMGFSVRRNTTGVKDGHIWYRLFTCSNQGTRSKQYLEMTHRQYEHRSLTRCDCPASLRLLWNNDIKMYTVSKVVLDHSHALLPEFCVPHLRSHRKVDAPSLAQALTMRASGISTTQIMDVFKYQGQGYNNVGFLKKDLYNILSRVRCAEISIGDANAAIAYLIEKQVADHSFFFAHTVDRENKLDRIFWADGRSRKEWAAFGRVLIFDATYKTNSYRFPLIVLAGVNNHRQTCIFGAALVKNETTESYKWVLQQLMLANNNVHPEGVVTDGDKSMAAAIGIVFPLARHRLCRWHLCRNASSNIQIRNFNDIFSYYMSADCTVQEFERGWEEMVCHYQLRTNKWIKKTYRRKHLWAEAYLRGQFFGLVKSTQRCEGINATLNRYLGNNRTLLAFFKDYDRGLENTRMKVVDQEYKSNYTNVVLTLEMLELEQQVSTIFTRALFFKIRRQMAREAWLWHDDMHEILGVGSNGRGVSPYFVRKVEFQENNGIQSISTARMNDIGKKQSEKNSDIFTSMRIQVTYHLSVQIFLCYSLWTTFAIMHGRDYAVMMATNGIASLVYGIGIAIFIRYARPEIRAHTHFSCSVCLIVLIIYIICASLLDRDITYPAVGFSCSALNIWDEIYVLWSDVRTVRATHTATHLFFDVVFLPTLKGGILVAYSYLKKSIFFMVTYSVVFLVGIGRLYLYFCYPRNQIANPLDNDQELVDHLSGEHVENRRGDIEAPPELDTQEERSGDVKPPRELGSQQEQRSGDVEPPRELGTQQEQRSGDVEPPRELGTQQEQELEADVHYLIKCVGLFFIWLIIYFIPLVFEL